MTEKTLQRTFVWGTVLFLVMLTGMTADSLQKVNSGRTPAVTDQVAHGKYVFQRKNCNDCHTILGIGGYFAPDLTKVADKRDAAWLKTFLANPRQAKPGTTMPDQKLTQADVLDLVAFFNWVRRIDTNGWPPKPLNSYAVASNHPSAPSVWQAKGCDGCHMVDGVGATEGPDLSHIGSQPYQGLGNSPEYLTRWLVDPSALMPDAQMPSAHLTPAQIDTLVRYLVALK